MGYLDPTSDFRWIKPNETDANSPLSEELMSQYRKNIEAMVMDNKASGIRFTVTSVGTSPNENQITVEKVDSGDPDWLANQYENLVVTFAESSLGAGNNFTIDSHTALVGSGTAVITAVAGTNFGGAGVAAGDEGYIFYVLTGRGHTHNGTDSAPLAVSTLLSSDDEVYQSNDLRLTTSIDTPWRTIIGRNGMTGVEAFVSLRRPSSNSDGSGTQYNFSGYGTLTIYTEVRGTGSSYTASSDNGFQSKTNSALTGTSLVITAAEFDTVASGTEEIRIKIPILQIGSLGLSSDEGFTIRVALEFNPNGEGSPQKYGNVTQINYYSVY